MMSLVCHFRPPVGCRSLFPTSNSRRYDEYSGGEPLKRGFFWKHPEGAGPVLHLPLDASLDGAGCSQLPSDAVWPLEDGQALRLVFLEPVREAVCFAPVHPRHLFQGGFRELPAWSISHGLQQPAGLLPALRRVRLTEGFA